MSVVPDLTDHLGYWLRQLSNHVSHAFARKLAGKDITVAEWVLMRVTYGQESLPPSAIADRMGMTRGAISKLADRLIGKGLIVRGASAGDRRSHTLALTAKGAALVPELATLADRNEAECFAHLGDVEREALRRILETCVERLGIAATPVD